MAKDIFRKARPEPPKWFWLYSDSCYDCNRKNMDVIHAKD